MPIEFENLTKIVIEDIDPVTKIVVEGPEVTKIVVSEQGPAGPQGATGPAGDGSGGGGNGASGATGATGASGISITGSTGPTGPQGATGPAGTGDGDAIWQQEEVEDYQGNPFTAVTTLDDLPVVLKESLNLNDYALFLRQFGDLNHSIRWGYTRHGIDGPVVNGYQDVGFATGNAISGTDLLVARISSNGIETLDSNGEMQFVVLDNDPRLAPGETGPTGPTGETGPRGTKIFPGTSAPVSGAIEGDFFLDEVYNVMYLYTSGNWEFYASIQGDPGNDGATGPQGATGPTGADSTVPGPQGFTGPQGATGSTGPAGTQGATGPAGSPASVATDSIFDTKGDIPVGIGADAAVKLPVTSTGVLTTDPSATTGLMYGLPVGGVLVRPVVSGAYYAIPRQTTGTATFAQDFIRYIPFIIHERHTFDRIIIYTTLTTSGSARLGIYDATGSNSMPGALILDAGAVATTAATGERAITITQTMAPGTIYWLAVNFNASTVAAHSQRSVYTEPLWGELAALSGPQFAATQSFTYGAMPATATPTPAAASTPTIWLRG